MIKSEPDLSIVEVAEEQVDSPIEPKYNMCNAHCASTKFTIFSAGGGEGGGDGEGPDHLLLRLLLHSGSLLSGARRCQLLDTGW